MFVGGMYTMLKDTKMELMMFATGKIYKARAQHQKWTALLLERKEETIATEKEMPLGKGQISLGVYSTE